MSDRLLLERAWVDGAVRDDVLVEVSGGRFTAVVPGASVADAERVAGLALPGLANCHSHAFHRALRGRTQQGSGTFWTWRERMYDLAGWLTPEGYGRLARAVFREMVAGGITTVGEFHYLHHRPDGTAYDDPNAFGHALADAARDAGIRLVLLDACYLSSGFGAPPTTAQLRYSDGSAAGWSDRTAQLHGSVAAGRLRAGAAVHSVRAVPREELGAFRGRAPLHVHLSEQPAENDDCRAAYGVTPTRLLHDAGLLGPGTTVVHATHLTDEDVALLGDSGTTACFCPTTERDLGDGIGPGRRLHEAGARLSLGSDSHAVVDLFEEMRALELDERLAARTRGHWTAAELLAAGTRHDSLGVDDAAAIEVGRRADLVVVDTRSVRTAGTGADEHTAVFAASAADVVRTMVDGRVVWDRDEDGAAEALGRGLAAAIEEVWR
ncbi:formimidoylglutamate deiminase [Nocardioides deserti]|uniref:Formimidoylglutamate deiminase n=1 Tax=Nocardioides deserti TaxID=1588644 RepID=A0ABR6U5T9_9ACTN|nr:formimidoylglutamate deiminase [Nocardioides deserti]MBC2959765.1 formimidoylglutamate deiminase [Nocardioides deserti]GGO74512.1 formimidoylglutamate deiminase [Nocardioides deserti]